MGYTLDAFGKPVFDDAFNLPEDLQVGADFADTFANSRSGTAAQRNALQPGQLRDGMLFLEHDTGTIYQWRGMDGWAVVFRDWLPYVPTITNMAGAITAAYQQVGKTVNVALRNVVTSVGSSPRFTLPVAADHPGVEFLNAAVMLTDVSAASYVLGVIRRLNATDCELFSVTASAAYATMGGVTATIPFTWASGDLIAINLSYRAA